MQFIKSLAKLQHTPFRPLSDPLLLALERRKWNKRLRRFKQDRERRRNQYRDAGIEFDSKDEIIEKLNVDGYVRIPNVFDREQLAGLRGDVEHLLDQGKSLRPVSRDSARPAGSVVATKERMTGDEICRGQAFCRQHTNHMAIANPLSNCPATIPFAFHQQLIDIAAGYLDCVPAIGGLNLRKSFVNELPSFDTLYFHVDPNSPRFLKFFYYLNDVDIDGGPFCFVRGSHRTKFAGWTTQRRWTLEEMQQHYSDDQIVNITGNMGDLIVADTTGFHRGTKATASDRAMLTVDYVVHPEFDGRQAKSDFQIDKSRLATMSLKQQAAADFLEHVSEGLTKAA